jgi:putative endonuclease
LFTGARQFRAWGVHKIVKDYYVYILTNASHTVLYTGMTNDLKRRVYEHKQKLASKFTARYNVDALVYYETGIDVREIIAREKQIKAGSRQDKIDLIESINKEWRDLYYEL